MADESIFRFMTVRPAHLRRNTSSLKRLATFESGTAGSTTLATFTAAVAAGATRSELEEEARTAKNGTSYVRSPSELSFDVAPFVEWLDENEGETYSTVDLPATIQSLYGDTPVNIIASGSFTDSFLRLEETMLIDSIVEEDDITQTRVSDDLIVAFKAMSLISQVARTTVDLQPDDLVGSFLSHSSIVLPDLANLLQLPLEEPDEPEPEEPDEEAAAQAALRERLAQLEAAHREISRFARHERFRATPPVPPPGEFPPQPPGGSPTGPCSGHIIRSQKIECEIRNLANASQQAGRNEALASRFVAMAARNGAPTALAAPESSQYIFSSDAYGQLSTETQQVLTELLYDSQAVNPAKALGDIEHEMEQIGAQLKAQNTFDLVIPLGGIYLSTKKFYQSIGYPAAVPGLIVADFKQCKFKAGVGDLLMVKQTLKAYELAEFAHVENVMASELREREHRRLTVREEEFVNEIERETETTRDLQSTERHELQSEAEKTLQSQFELESGLQISGSYGPVIGFEASLNVGFSTSVSESKKKATKYSREVTERSSERIRERVREERRIKTVEEIEETNKHAFDNQGAGATHIRGVYRWLNKIYDAQVFNYGQRMMYEFVIPEPAAFFLYALVENPPQEEELIKPEPPRFPNDPGGNPLRADNLTRANYHEYISQYQVTNVPPPPPARRTVSYFDKHEGVELGVFGRSGKVEVPAGYEAYGATVHALCVSLSDYTDPDAEPREMGLVLTMGDKTYDLAFNQGATYQSFDEPRRGEIGYAMGAFSVVSWSISTDIWCQLTSEGELAWKQEVYDAIMESYQQMKTTYEEKLAARRVGEGVRILGRNPLENRRIEREELKKLVLQMLTGINDFNIDLYVNAPDPRMKIEEACKTGSKLRFFENAFEWQNMLHVFYPYFWGKKSKYISALHMVDPDPDFAAFLKAGAARVQVPVRPGFEKAVAHFCQFGKIWEGNDPPLKNDALYVPIIDEITANLGKLDGGVPYPEGSEPWEVTIPTSLVVLQDIDEVSAIQDILTGQPIDMDSGDDLGA